MTIKKHFFVEFRPVPFHCESWKGLFQDTWNSAEGALFSEVFLRNGILSNPIRRSFHCGNNRTKTTKTFDLAIFKPVFKITFMYNFLRFSWFVTSATNRGGGKRRVWRTTFLTPPESIFVDNIRPTFGFYPRLRISFWQICPDPVVFIIRLKIRTQWEIYFRYVAKYFTCIHRQRSQLTPKKLVNVKRIAYSTE